jgi:DNA-directed RNA polymerase
MDSKEYLTNTADPDLIKAVELYGIEIVSKQIDLEIEGQEIGKQRFLKRINDRHAGKDTSGALLGTAKTVLSEALPRMSKAVNDFLDEVYNGRVGRKQASAQHIKELDIETVVYITIHTVLNTVLKRTIAKFSGYPFAKLSTEVGRALEEEIRFNKLFNAVDKKTAACLRKEVDKRIGYSYKRAYMLANERRLKDENILNYDETSEGAWSAEKATLVGSKLIELLIESTGIVKVVLTNITNEGKSKSPKTLYVVTIEPDLMKYIEQNDQFLAELDRYAMPTLIPPKPWSSVVNGGYYMEVKRPLKFIRIPTKKLLESYTDLELDSVMESVNKIQETAWRINKPVLDILRDVLYRNNVEIEDVPSREAAPKPLMPCTPEENPEMHKAWRKQMHRWYQEDNRRVGKRLRIEMTMAQAIKFKEYPEIYFPHNLDFRGRVYPVTHLSPQGDDLMKGMLEFANGVPIGEHGAKWLAIHLANTYGKDKLTFEGRLKWVEDNKELFINIAENPQDTVDIWGKADSPVCFLATCLEWVGYLKTGESFVSHIPVAFDGSCSGIQHFSAMLRDEVGGAAVNLVPSDKVEDIYQRVANVVLIAMSKDLMEGTPDEIVKKIDDGTGKEMSYKRLGTKSLAKEWDRFGVTRKVTKRCVMTLPYGSKEYGFADHIHDDTVQPAKLKDPTCFTSANQASRYMASLIWSAVSQVVIKSVEAMSWLQKAASLLSAQKDARGESLPVFWVTPIGFPVWQNYRKLEMKKVNPVFRAGTYVQSYVKDENTSPDGTLKCHDEGIPKRLQVRVPVKEGEIDKYKQRNGIAPNYVHSMDASHLLLTVLHCNEEYNMTSFAMIHDSYGTHAGNAEFLFKGVRDVFVKTYTENNVMQDLHDQICLQLDTKVLKDLPPIPEMGTLELEKVKDSLYAFA